ncbi:hypothetical protein [Bacillus sp. EAC]|uniref:UPF0738 family protein n=1 Tax=Bacillus sp. EAC TaxID=1978338 RepID=UPI000B436685|nr:hypothetical protein [Bacillus sp. EAC]
MRKMLTIEEIIQNEDGLFFKIEDNETLNFDNCHEIGTMIADSEQNSLLYIIEENEEFVYITIPVTLWAHIKKANDQHQKVFLQSRDGQLELNSWNDELTYLVQNVEGNFNYGEEFVKQIQKVFLEEK